MRLLNENEIVDAVVDFLSGSGWTIDQKRHGHQRGVDVIATGPDGAQVFIEAKGATSSRVGSAKYGQPMGSAEVRINIAEALYTAAAAAVREVPSGHTAALSAIALYDDPCHRRFVEPIVPALSDLGIGIYWVGGDLAVSFETPSVSRASSA